MTNETGLLRDLNLKPGDRVCDGLGRDVDIIERNGSLRAMWLDGNEISVDCADDTYTVTHREPRTIGTLKEIGAKVGDVVRSNESGNEFEVWQRALDCFLDNCYTIISRATPEGPVRNVTKTEIVPGVYGCVSVSHVWPGLGVALIDPNIQADYVGHAILTKDELTAAINTLTEIRDAL